MVSRRSKSHLNLLVDGKSKMLPRSSKSTESLYSNSSSKYSTSAVQKRKQTSSTGVTGLTTGTTNGITTGNTGGSRLCFIPASTEVRQRVLSARRLRMKTLQNQLTDAQMHIAELSHENRILRTLHKRQDNALAKYESTNAELPQLLHSHSEEIRVWQTKYRSLQIQNKELAYKLKQKDSAILNLNDQNKHLSQLNNDKNLEERERLTERVRDLEQKLIEKENDMKLLARKLQLEAKGYKSQLNAEHSRYKDIVLRLEKTRSELSGLSKVDNLDLPDKMSKITFPTKPAAFKPKSAKEPNKSPRINSDESFVNSNASEIKSSNTSVGVVEKAKTPVFTRKPENNSHHSSISNKPLSLSRKSPVPSDDIGEAIKMGMKSLKKSIDESDEEERAIEELQRKDDFYLQDNDFVFRKPYAEVKNDDGDEDDDVIISAGMPDKTKTDFQSIRKQISNDYKEREKFLDKFCRESSTDALKEDFKRPIDTKKKVSLLAALKAIDENKSKDI